MPFLRFALAIWPNMDEMRRQIKDKIASSTLCFPRGFGVLFTCYVKFHGFMLIKNQFQVPTGRQIV